MTDFASKIDVLISCGVRNQVEIMVNRISVTQAFTDVISVAGCIPNPGSAARLVNSMIGGGT